MTDWKKSGEILLQLLSEIYPGFFNNVEVIGIQDYDLNQTREPLTMGELIKLDLRIRAIIKPKDFPAKELSDKINTTFQKLKAGP